MPQVFLSYAPGDRDVADQLAWALHSRGVMVWLDGRGSVDAPFAVQLADALRTAETVIVLWSQDALTAPFVRAEAKEGLATRRLINVVYTEELTDEDVPAMFASAPVLPYDEDKHANVDAIVDAVDAVSAAAHAARPSPLIAPPEDADAQARILVDAITHSAQADWLGLAEGRSAGFIEKMQAAFAVAARKLANAAAPEWRAGLTGLQSPDTRLDTLYALETLAASDDGGADWRRAVADLAWPFHPIRALGGYAAADVALADQDALAAPFAMAALRPSRSGVVQTAEAPNGDPGSWRGAAWLFATIVAAALLLFFLNQVDDPAPEPSEFAALEPGRETAPLPADTTKSEPPAVSPSAETPSPQAVQPVTPPTLEAPASPDVEDAPATAPAPPPAPASTPTLDDDDAPATPTIAQPPPWSPPATDDGLTPPPTRTFAPRECENTETTTYVVQSGDSLWTIAQAHYGAGCGARAADIFIASTEIFTGEAAGAAPWRASANPDLIYPGETLTLPARAA